MGGSVPKNIAQRESEWRHHLARHAASGQSIAAFCRSEAISEGSFYFWRTRLQVKPTKDASTPPLPASTPFIDLGIVTKPNASMLTHADRMPTATPSGVEVRIDLGGGIVLTIARH